MTPDQIRSLKPGPELDRAVAETLFGYRVHHVCTEPTWIQGGRFWADPGEIAIIGESTLCEAAAYSSTWAGLGLVVEEMERRGWLFSIDKHSNSHIDGGRWMALWGLGHLIRSAGGDTAMECVCRAALLALAAEKGQQP